MLKNKNIIYLSNVFWKETWFSKQALALEFSKYNKILYIDPPVNLFSIARYRKRMAYLGSPIEKINKNLVRYTPFLLAPYHKWKYTLGLNCKLLTWKILRKIQRYSFKEPILWINRPQYYCLLGKFKERLSIYHCTDEYTAIPGINRKLMLDSEKKLLSKVNLVITVSPILTKKKKRFNPHTYFVPNACNSDYFKKRTFQIPEDLSKINRPRIGFSGSLNARIDVDLIERMVKEKPNWQFVFVGPKGRRYFVKEEYTRLKSLKNVHLLGERFKEILPQYINFFDVCIIPYKDNEFNRCSCPLKVYEYLALGKPVVSSYIPSFEGLKEVVHLSRSHSEFIHNLEKALKEDNSLYKEKRIEIAKQNTWEKRAEEISKIIQKTFRDKK